MFARGGGGGGGGGTQRQSSENDICHYGTRVRVREYGYHAPLMLLSTFINVIVL